MTQRPHFRALSFSPSSLFSNIHLYVKKRVFIEGRNLALIPVGSVLSLTPTALIKRCDLTCRGKAFLSNFHPSNMPS